MAQPLGYSDPISFDVLNVDACVLAPVSMRSLAHLARLGPSLVDLMGPRPFDHRCAEFNGQIGSRTWDSLI